MSATATINNITTQIAAYTPAVLAGVQAAEASNASGQQKQTAVVSSILQGVQVGSGDLAQSTNPTVAAVATLVNLVVSIFNMLGVFNHGAAVTVKG